MGETKYLSAKEAAEKWSLTPRRVQQLCKEGHVAAAERRGRSWLIPENAKKPKAEDGAGAHPTNGSRSVVKTSPFMPLTASPFPLGCCTEYLRRFPRDVQPLAWAEYHYYCGRAEQAAAFAEPYLSHRNLEKKLTACILYGFANLSLGRIHSARFALNSIKETLAPLQHQKIDEFTKAICVFAATMASTLLHLPSRDIPPLENYLRHLPDGLKLYACYLLAHQTYLHQNYEKALGIAELALTWCRSLYPIPAIYLHVIAAICSMNVKQTEEAREHFRLAWEIAGPDDLIEAIGEHHGLLQGLIEAILKTDNPEDYERVIAITYRFSSGWRKIHNPDAKHFVADDLTTTEFTAAMLADRGWSYQEIADQMKLSPHTIGKYLSSVYRKLGIKTKEELRTYMLY